MILDYTRNKYASATDLEDGSVLIQTRVEDTFFAAAVEMVVKVPLLEITSIKGKILRAFNDECQEAVPLLQRAVGVQIGTGLIKTVNGLIGTSGGCPRMADLVLECCDEVILRFTVDPLRQIVSRSPEELVEAHRMFVQGNPRIIGSCVAWTKGSPLLEGIEI